jgi:ABC-type multidrug transport system ATPase subunit
MYKVIKTNKDVNIGDEDTRGISGGQRKRVNIGIELCAIPTCIFLDEPTSGLDSTAALEVCDNLRQIAALGLTIVSVIHQPRIEIFEKFHDVFLIAPGGQTAYLGPIKECQPYFESHGYYFDPRVNPADVLMDILSGKGVNEKNSYTSDNLVKLWALKKSTEAAAQAKENVKNGEKLDAQTVSESQKSETFHSTVPELIKERGAGFFMQMYHCHQRSLMQQYAGANTFILECATSIFAGGVIALSASSQPYIYRGLYIQPLTLLSPSSMDWLVPCIYLLT